MEILQENNPSKGFFKAIENAKEAGLVAYTWAGEDKIVIDQTEINPEFYGKDIGTKLVQKAVEFARESKLKIIPLCPFAKSVFNKTDEIKDVLF